MSSVLRSRHARRPLLVIAAVAMAAIVSVAAVPSAQAAGRAPNTKITRGPAEGAKIGTTTTKFSFVATSRATFRCSLNGAKYRACRSPVSYHGLSKRRHTFRVKAVKRAGVADRTPAKRRFTVAKPGSRGAATTPTTAPAPAGGVPGSSGVGATGCSRAYSPSSPWNTPVPANVAVDAASAAKVATMEPAAAKLTSDPTQYTFPVYYADATTPRVPVTHIDGWLSDVRAAGTSLLNSRHRDPAQRVATMPIPPETAAAAGYDAQIVVIDTVTGEEWDASHFTRDASGYHAWNIGRYNTSWSAVPPLDANGNPYWIRGPGIPYLAGLIRPCEIQQGRIDHALAFAYPATTTDFVYPATRSDGQSASGNGMAEGTRLQLSPSISDTTIKDTWRCTNACFTIAKALQRYGMYIADSGGRPKIMPEYEGTAHWNGTLTDKTPSPIPLSAFRVVAPPAR